MDSQLQHDTAAPKFSAIFPYPQPLSLLDKPYPERFKLQMQEARTNNFMPAVCLDCSDDVVAAIDNSD